jgi:hypothetical protein
VPDDQFAQVVLAGDVPEHRGRHAPHQRRALAHRHQPVEVGRRLFEQLRRLTVQFAVGALAGQPRLAHGRGGRDEAWWFGHIHGPHGHTRGSSGRPISAVTGQPPAA